MQIDVRPDNQLSLHILRCAVRAETAARNSRFIAQLVSLESLAEIRVHVERCRAEHPAASHVVHAAVVGTSINSLQYSTSDDGEPKGTAGRPALEILRSSALTNVVLTIVRYFGGTRLGTGGLVRAYADAARAVLQAAHTEPLVERSAIRLVVRYEAYQGVRRALSAGGATIMDEQFGAEVSLSASVPFSGLEALRLAVRDVSRGTVSVVVVSE
ncbi:MAG: DUF1949 domain-containing protein [Spirochaetaceae bacterium]|nr:MAG: DUF1949 domain-containing protein [Spirochaetaceae bacterium]